METADNDQTGNDFFDKEAPKYPECAADPNGIPAEASGVYAGPNPNGMAYAGPNPAGMLMAYAGPKAPTMPNMAEQMQKGYMELDMRQPSGMVYAGPGYRPGSSAFFTSGGADKMSGFAGSPNKDFKFCMECGAKNKRTNKFCTDCGTPFPPEVQKV